MDAGSELPRVETPPRPPLWRGDGTIGRALRFTLAVMGPIGIGLVVGPAPWMTYGIVTTILAFLLDMGGRFAPRLGWMLGAAFVICAGAAFGTLVHDHPVSTFLAFSLAGIAYALVEALNPGIAGAVRLFCLALAIGAHFVQITPLNAAAAFAAALYGYLISVLWDLLIGGERPSSAPYLAEIVKRLRMTERERWRFAAAVAIVLPLSSVASVALGLHKPYWTLIAVVVVLRQDALSSQRIMLEVMIGSVLGVAIAIAIALLVPDRGWLIGAMLLAALLRWPAQDYNGVFGNAALAAFIALLLQVVDRSFGLAAHDTEERVLDFALGCSFAMLGLLLDWTFARIAGHAPGR
ncbi:FUSC family protein [Ancylobacter sp. 6x-1]|uniref:FUSC family protein n=1 Tax=Ancylobacter crimeensis TaxID=2579147 RepID=A0ABT0D7Q0_9HYPH|nr:FUSC family protein [Ancylobacter crimeensis]MCK0195967.1 FUSC family protein [Ancylobacter crimeensis]